MLQALIATKLTLPFLQPQSPVSKMSPVRLLVSWPYLRNHEMGLVEYPDPSLSFFAGTSFAEPHATICHEKYFDCAA